MNWARKDKAARAHLFPSLKPGDRSLCKALTIKGDELKDIDATVSPCLTCAMLNKKAANGTHRS